MSDMPIRNVQRETFNAQLSTERPKGRMVAGIWGQTRNLDRGRHMGTDTQFWTTGLLTRLTGLCARQTVEAGCGTQIRGQTWS